MKNGVIIDAGKIKKPFFGTPRAIYRTSGAIFGTPRAFFGTPGAIA